VNWKDLSMQRAISFGALGMFINGVALHQWYMVLERTIGSSMQSRSVIASKIIADQLVYAPFSIAVFFGYSVFSAAVNELQHSKEALRSVKVSPSDTALVGSSRVTSSNFTSCNTTSSKESFMAE